MICLRDDTKSSQQVSDPADTRGTSYTVVESTCNVTTYARIGFRGGCKKVPRSNRIRCQRYGYKSRFTRERVVSRPLHQKVLSKIHTSGIYRSGRRSGPLAVPLTERLRTRRWRYFSHFAHNFFDLGLRRTHREISLRRRAWALPPPSCRRMCSRHLQRAPRASPGTSCQGRVAPRPPAGRARAAE